MPLQATSGAASYDGFGGGVVAEPNYIESCFSTYLYTGNGSTQTITNGIDLSGKGGMVWIKARNTVDSHRLFDTTRGVGNYLVTNGTFAQLNNASSVTAFNSTGFDLGSFAGTNDAFNYASWTFRKQPKFFDVVTWSGNGTTQAISHNLGSVPGFIAIKRTDSADDWWCFHRYDFTYRTKLNATNAAVNTNNQSYLGNNTTAVTPTSTTFTVGSIGGINDAAGTYVAYLFAHDAGGFGLTGSDNVISCGSFTTDGSGAYSVTLGYEPQFVLMKRTDSTGDWLLMDNMRGMPVGGNDAILRPNTSGAETETFDCANPTATGFYESTGSLGASRTFIYIAIRRGPMKVPTVGTSVFQPTAFTSQSGADTVSSGSVSVVDWGFVKKRASSEVWIAGDRLRGGSYLSFDATSAEASNVFKWDKQNAFVTNVDDTPSSFIGYSFRRAPSFFDEVCYNCNGATQNVNHNLGVAPELMIVKKRSIDGTSNWVVYAAPLANADAYLFLNDTAAVATTSVVWNSTAPTSTVFSLGASTNINQSGQTAVAYLFATCAGVSKVGSYTGTATTKQIDCGFTAGARFVLIKRTDSTGDWYVWDTARGIVSGNDPYLLLNSTAAEVTNTDYVDTYSAGFEISSTAPAAINASGGTFIFLAIA